MMSERQKYLNNSPLLQKFISQRILPQHAVNCNHLKTSLIIIKRMKIPQNHFVPNFAYILQIKIRS